MGLSPPRAAVNLLRNRALPASYDMRVLLVSPTALDMAGRPIKQRRIHLPGLTLQRLAAATPRNVTLRLVNDTAQGIRFNQPWDDAGVAECRGVPGEGQPGGDRRTCGQPMSPGMDTSPRGLAGGR